MVEVAGIRVRETCPVVFELCIAHGTIPRRHAQSTRELDKVDWRTVLAHARGEAAIIVDQANSHRRVLARCRSQRVQRIFEQEAEMLRHHPEPCRIRDCRVLAFGYPRTLLAFDDCRQSVRACQCS